MPMSFYTCREEIHGAKSQHIFSETRTESTGTRYKSQSATLSSIPMPELIRQRLQVSICVIHSAPLRSK